MLLGASDLLHAYWPALLIGPVLIALLIRYWIASPHRRAALDRHLLRLPLVGSLIADIEVARFSRTLGALLKNGVSLLIALAITRDTVRNAVFLDAISSIIERVKAGKGMAGPIEQTKIFPALALHLIRVGEESGRQDDMLLKIADILEQETRTKIDRLLTLLTPAVTIVLGAIVGGVIMSILTALLSVYDLAI